jgi:hypothetical protein
MKFNVSKQIEKRVFRIVLKPALTQFGCYAELYVDFLSFPSKIPK